MNPGPRLFRVLTAGWMLLIFLLSSQPSLPAIRMLSGADLLAHAVVYGVLCMFLALSFESPQAVTWRRIFFLTMLVTAYGIIDEYHQSFVPGRHASPWDVLADGAGGFIVAWTMRWHYRRTIQTS